MFAVHDSVSCIDGTEGAEQVLDHEAADAGAGVDRGQDEQRLEQDGEVVPERHHRLAADHARQDVRHADRERRRAAGARQDGVLADVLGESGSACPG